MTNTDAVSNIVAIKTGFSSIIRLKAIDSGMYYIEVREYGKMDWLTVHFETSKARAMGVLNLLTYSKPVMDVMVKEARLLREQAELELQTGSVK